MGRNKQDAQWHRQHSPLRFSINSLLTLRYRVIRSSFTFVYLYTPLVLLIMYPTFERRNAGGYRTNGCIAYLARPDCWQTMVVCIGILLRRY